MYVAGFAGGGVIIQQYSLSTPWVITSGVTFDGSYSSGGGTSAGIEFSVDGTKLFMSDFNGGGNSIVRQYSLATPFVITSGVTFDSGATYTAPDIPAGIQDVTFSPDGLKIQMADFSGGNMYEDTLTSAWDLSTAQGSTGRVIRPNGVMIPPAFNSPIIACVWKNDDGSKMYLLDGIFDIYVSNTP